MQGVYSLIWHNRTTSWKPADQERTRKYNKNIDFDAYKAYRNARNRPPPTPPSSTNVLASSVIDQELHSTRSEHTDAKSTKNTTANNTAPAPTTEPSGILPSSINANEPPAPYPTSFAHIVDLITSGKPVPGIKEIPPTVLEGQGTQATKPKRKKPWEKDEVDVEGAKETSSA